MKLIRWFAVAMIATGSLLTINTGRAQDAANTPAVTQHHGHRGAYFKQLAQNLNLTKDQEKQLRTTFKTEHQKLKALRQDSSLSKPDRRTQARAIHKDAMAKIKEILTPEQLAKWREYMRQHRRGNNRGHHQSNN